MKNNTKESISIIIEVMLAVMIVCVSVALEFGNLLYLGFGNYKNELEEVFTIIVLCADPVVVIYMAYNLVNMLIKSNYMRLYHTAQYRLSILYQSIIIAVSLLSHEDASVLIILGIIGAFYFYSKYNKSMKEIYSIIREKKGDAES